MKLRKNTYQNVQFFGFGSYFLLSFNFRPFEFAAAVLKNEKLRKKGTNLSFKKKVVNQERPVVEEFGDHVLIIITIIIKIIIIIIIIINILAVIAILLAIFLILLIF